MSSISSVSFWQQDQSYWSQASSRDQSLANSDALITDMGTIETNEVKGLASIANQTALNRVNSALTAAIQSELQSTTGSSSSSSASSTSSSASSSSGSSGSSSSNSSSSNSSGSTVTLASGTGTVPLTTSTPLSTLLIPPNGTITVSDGTNTTLYASTGSDTVGNLINALNTNLPGNAQVNASLNSNGNLVITAKFSKDPVVVGGTFAPSIGFGSGNNDFQPGAASNSSSSSGSSGTSSPSTTSSSSGTTQSTGSSSTTASTSSSGIATNSALALQTAGTAELLLASNGSTGSLVNLLA
jgi:hypothetical protein